MTSDRRATCLAVATFSGDEIALAGHSLSVRTLNRAIAVLAPLDTHTLLCGEPGTGRSTCAQMLHRQGPRRSLPFLAASIAGLAEDAIAERLFGPDGIAKRAADVGHATLYIDAIDQLPLSLQARLLATLGSGADPGVRLLAATATPLGERLRHGRFDPALYERLGTVQLSLPPLRERREDIAPIAADVVHRWNHTHPKRPHALASAAIDVLEAYAWPGNVRELAHAVETACSQSRTRSISAERVRAVLGRRPRRAVTPDIVSLHQIECDYILLALERSGGNRSLAAARLGISRGMLTRRLAGC